MYKQNQIDMEIELDRYQDRTRQILEQMDRYATEKDR